MKSFKVIDLKIIQEQNFIVPEVLDGVIINLEEGEEPWIIEIVTSSHLSSVLTKLKDQQLDMMVTITRPTNTPAKFSATLMDIHDKEDKTSVIFKGAIVTHGPNYAENLLAYLVEKGYEGESLIKEFNVRMESKEDFEKEEE